MKIKLLLFVIAWLTVVFSWGNNVAVNDVKLSGQNVVTDTKDIEFDLSWDNSWRTSAVPSNWDACWVFAKYRLTSGTNWNHATLSSVDGDHTAPAGSTIDAVADGKGVFIYRSADGTGSNAWNSVKLEWDYGADGLLDNDSVEICVFAIEMVNIPAGEFDLGDGNGVNESAYAFESAAANNTAVHISTSLSVQIETDASTTFDDAQLGSTGLYLDGDGGIDLNGDGDFIDAGDNPLFPVGYDSVYCMKYEITQGQYVAFLNKLTAAQAPTLQSNQVSDVSRQRITGSGNNWSTTYPNRPVALGSRELCAYLDWAALRPMTETEFEKIARGETPAVLQEYAWGTNTVFSSAAYTFVNDGTATEDITNMGASIGNSNYGTTDPNGVVRVGIFASGSINHTREETGGSYYGVMELSGNVYELCVFLGDPNGRRYTALNGDGSLQSNGYANVVNWPGWNGTQNTGSLGDMVPRGGFFGSPTSALRISDRTEVDVHQYTRIAGFGGRGVRTP